MKISFTGVRAGGGKSYAITDVCIQRYEQGKKTLILAPTKKLIDQIASIIQIKRPNIEINVFYSSEISNNSVIAQVVNHFKNTHLNGEVTIITHACFFSLPYFYRKMRWKVFVDEAPSIYDSNVVRLPNNHSILTDHIRVQGSGSTYGYLEVTNPTAIKQIADNKGGDDFYNLIRPLAKSLLDRNRQSWVRLTAFNDLISGERLRDGMTIHTIIKPQVFEGFEDVTIAAAGFESTFIYHCWERDGVSWTCDEELYAKLYRKEHPNNPTVNIYFGYERSNSKTMRNKLIAKEDDSLRQSAIKLMDGQKFVWSENKDYEAKSILNECKNGELLPAISHGLNKYEGTHNIVVLGAYNFKQDQSDFFDKVYGFNRVLQTEAMHLQIYQSVLRTSIRLDDMTHAKKVVVASRVDAELLHERLPGSIVQALDIPQLEQTKRGPKQKHATSNDRKRASEKRVKDNEMLRIRVADHISADVLNGSIKWEKSDDLLYKSLDEFVQEFQGSYFDHWKRTDPFLICMNKDKWRKQLKDMHNNSFSGKHEIPMISGAMFNAGKGNGATRNDSNVEFIKDIWLDFDEGDLCLEKFTTMLPQIEMIAYNTFNHTKYNPRFRVLIPTSRAMRVYEAVSIYHEITHVLNSNGYRIGTRKNSRIVRKDNYAYSGLDYRPNPSLLSGLPCQARNPKHSFFEEFTDGRSPLDVTEWFRQASYIEAGSDYLPLPPIPTDDLELRQDHHMEIDAARKEWSAQTAIRGNGNRAMFEFSIALRNAQVPLYVIEQELICAANNSISRVDRRAQVKRIIKKFRCDMH